MANDGYQRHEKEKAVRILHVEDDPRDRELVAETLRAGGVNCDILCVQSAAEFRSAIGQHEFDVILSDFAMPLLNGSVALAIAKILRPNIPFLFVSGTIAEERALEIVKFGATDYVLKNRLQRLAPAVRRALREAHEHAERLNAELRIRQLYRTYVVLSAINQMIVRGEEPQAILDGACRIAVDKGDFRMAWIGMLDAAGQILKPAAFAGRVDGFLDAEHPGLNTTGSVEGPALKALESGEHQVCNDIGNDPHIPSRAAAMERGYRACAAFPLQVDGRTVGVLTLYAGETDFFDEEELRLLDELVDDIAFALKSHQRDLQRRHTLEQLRASEERFRELAETVQEVFWIVDPDPAKNQMLYVSPAYERIWGRTCQSLYSHPASWLDAIHPEDRERIRHAAATQQADGAYDEEYRIIRPDLQIRWIRDTAFPARNAAGKVERIIGVARDITERREMAEQLRQSQKMEAIGQLAGGVAHDFNNILAAVMLQARLSACTENTPREVLDGLQQIHAAAERAAGLVRQLLLFSRKQIMQARDLDLNDVVTNLAKMLQRIIGEDVHLHLHLHPAPLMTRADAGMLEQVLMNLAVNSRDAMPGGGQLLIETSERLVDDCLPRPHADAEPGQYMCLTVGDSGMGIPPEVLPRIFEPFFTTKEPGKGTGLGLATVFGIVKQHGGFINVESEPGKGSSFLIFLPASKVPPQSRAPQPQPKPKGGTETILLVEDEEAVRSLIRATLEGNGYRVLEAANGILALKLWEECRSTVALVLTDLVMPAGLSGQELARRLQQDKPGLKVLYTSGYSAEVAGRQADFQLGQNFLQKPYSPEQLLETIRRCLDNNQLPQTSRP